MSKSKAQRPKASKKKTLLRDILLRNHRAIFAFDDHGIHLRATLCVTHDGDSGKVSYDTDPVVSFEMADAKKRRDLMFQILEFIINADPGLSSRFEQFLSLKGGGK